LRHSHAGKKATAHSTYTIDKEIAHQYVVAWRTREEAAGKKRGQYIESFSIDAAGGIKSQGGKSLPGRIV
jgi:hypothetical protein